MTTTATETALLLTPEETKALANPKNALVIGAAFKLSASEAAHFVARLDVEEVGVISPGDAASAILVGAISVLAALK